MIGTHDDVRETSQRESSGPASGPPPRDFLTVGLTQTEFAADEQEAREIFARFHALHFGRLLAPELQQTVLGLCATGRFEPGEKDAPGFREVEAPQRAGRVLNVALDRPPLLRWLERVTGCETLSSLEGRVSQTLHRPGDELYWHDDFVETQGRQLAIVINLSTEPFEGGEFALRRKGGDVLFEHCYRELGSAMIFKVDRALEHRVRPLTAGGPRRVFAGWAFKAAQP